MKIKALFFLLLSTLAFSDLPLPTIDTSNGSLKLFYIDFKIPARGIDLEVTRGYWNQSESDYVGYFGNKWHSNLDLSLVYYPESSRKAIDINLSNRKRTEKTKTNPSKIKIFEENLTREFEARDGTTTFASIHHKYQIITRIPDGFIRETPDKTKYYFTQLVEEREVPNEDNWIKRWKDQEGNEHQTLYLYYIECPRKTYRLKKIEDRYGNTLSYEYDQNNRLKKITDPSGRSLNITTNLKGRITSITDPLNRTISYTYNYQGDLSSIIDQGERKTEFSYDSFHNLTRIAYPGGKIIQIEYDPGRKVIQVIEPNNKTTRYSYTMLNEGMVTTITDPRGNKITYSYEPGYYKYQEKTAIVTDQEGNTYKTVRDKRKQIIKEELPNGAIFSYSYDDRGNRTKVIDPEGNLWQYEYEPNFNRTKTAIDPKGNKTSFKYDNNGNLIETERPDGATIEREYNEYG
ncbi:MAG: DUF6531 domain-containing protein, partial [bacterium]